MSDAKVQADEKPPAALPARGEIAHAAFDLWALLNATKARMDQLEEEGLINAESSSELGRLIRSAASQAHEIGAKVAG